MTAQVLFFDFLFSKKTRTLMPLRCRWYNILYCSKSLKKINKDINRNLSQTMQWLRVNRISLNAKKTELIIFRPKNKSITKLLNFRISGQKINTVNKTKYLGIYLDEHLTWNFQLNQIKIKLSRSCVLLAKLRYHVKTKLLRTVILQFLTQC